MAEDSGEAVVGVGVVVVPGAGGVGVGAGPPEVEVVAGVRREVVREVSLRVPTSSSRQTED